MASAVTRRCGVRCGRFLKETAPHRPTQTAQTAPIPHPKPHCKPHSEVMQMDSTQTPYDPKPGDRVHVGERPEVYTVVSVDDLALVELESSQGKRLKAGYRTLVPAREDAA